MMNIDSIVSIFNYLLKCLCSIVLTQLSDVDKNNDNIINYDRALSGNKMNAMKIDSDYYLHSEPSADNQLETSIQKIASHHVDSVSSTTNATKITVSSASSKFVVQDLIINQKKLLIVEDSVLNLKFLRLLLEKRGHYCEVATNGHMSVNMVKATSSTANTEDLYLRCYDVILMNLVMSGMNGRDATRAIRQHGFTGPIIGMSSYLERSEIDSFLEAGATCVLPKPLVMNKVYEILSNL